MTQISIGKNSGGANAVALCVARFREKRELQMTLLAAWEVFDGQPEIKVHYACITAVNTPDCLLQTKQKETLKQMCRESIRDHLVKLNPHLYQMSSYTIQ